MAGFRADMGRDRGGRSIADGIPAESGVDDRKARLWVREISKKYHSPKLEHRETYVLERKTETTCDVDPVIGKTKGENDHVQE